MQKPISNFKFLETFFEKSRIKAPDPICLFQERDSFILCKAEYPIYYYAKIKTVLLKVYFVDLIEGRF